MIRNSIQHLHKKQIVKLFIVISLLLIVRTGFSAENLPDTTVKQHLEFKRLNELKFKKYGAFIGDLNGTIIIAGGSSAGYHELVSGQVNLSDTLFYLRPDTNVWEKIRLKTPIAFGTTISIPQGLVLAGGMTPFGTTSQVIKLSFESQQIKIDSLPELPVPLMGAGGCQLGDSLYIAGGVTSLNRTAKNRQLYVINWKKPGSGWISHSLPSAFQCISPILIAQNEEVHFIEGPNILGYDYKPETPPVFYAIWKYQPTVALGEKWKACRANVSVDIISSAVAFGPSHILVLGKSLPNPDTLYSGESQNNVFLAYHTITDTWVEYVQSDPKITGKSIFSLNQKIVLCQEEPNGKFVFYQVDYIYPQNHLTHLDYVIIIIYLVSLIWIGAYFSKKEKSIDDYFLGGRKVVWWAAGISIYATGVSAISFMAIPAKTYATNWLYLGSPIATVFSSYIVAYFFIPLFRRLNLTTIYEYLDLRFNRAVRLLGSFILLAYQVGGRMSVTLLLPSIALSAVTGFNIYASILVMGVLATFYTVMGGIHAVIWTDVLQVIVMFGGALLSFALILFHIDGGVGEMINIGMTHQKFLTFLYSWDFTLPTIFIFFFFGVADVMGKISDQPTMQRAFSTPDERAASRSMILCAVISIPGTILFFTLGTALFVFYSYHPAHLNPTLQTDGIFPLFITQRLPTGLSGLIVAGLFAAAMSTLDSSMNSVATVIVKDFYNYFKKDSDERRRLQTARFITILTGVISTGMALFMATFQIGSLWDVFSKLTALIGGGFPGVFALGLLTRRGNATGAFVGVIASIIVTLVIEKFTPLHFFIYGFIAIITTFGVGYITSLLFPRAHISLDGLTFVNLKSRYK
ncbi:sodium/solute symporter [candidate division KSB1 bacterium]|nr:sodium/solute symporter [candidate division KSB1 bacterium]